MSYLENLNVNPNHVLQAIGLRRQTESAVLTDTVLPALAVFGAGLLVGAGVALLLAPKSGRELRDDLGRRAGELQDNVRNRLPHQVTDALNSGDRSESRMNPNPM